MVHSFRNPEMFELYAALKAVVSEEDAPVVSAHLMAKQITILRHALGSDKKGQFTRNHYCTETGDPDCLRLVELGYMVGPVSRGHLPDNMSYFYVTQKGSELIQCMLDV